MFYWFINFEKWLQNQFGYTFVVHFEDIVLSGASFFVGFLTMAVMAGHVIFKLQKRDKLGQNTVKLMKFKVNGNRQYVADPKNTGEAIETLLLTIFAPFFRYKTYNYHDQRRTEIFLIFMLFFGIILVVLAYFSISNVILY